MADYLSERLGLGVRTAQELLRTQKALARLPRTAAAWMSGRISTSHLRILTRVATERTESWWLMVATCLSVAALAAEVARWRRSQAREAVPIPRGGSHEGTAPGEDPDEEPERERLDVSAPAWIVVFWRQTVELVRKVAGRRLPPGSCIDVLLAEAQGTAPVWEREAPAGTSREPEESGEAAAGASPQPDDEKDDHAAAGLGAAQAPCAAAPRPALSIIDRLIRRPFEPGRVAWWQLLPVREARRDPHDLDRELRGLAGGRQRDEAELARRLRLAAMTRSYRSEGYKTLESWGRDTLGLSARRLYYLLALNRKLEALPGLKGAFLEGRLTMMQVLLVGSVAGRRTEAAWIQRASEVTLRRLDDEVSWWRHIKEVRPEVWSLLDGGPLPAGLVLAPGKSPRLHASARETGARQDGRGSGEAFQDDTVPAYDDLHASARVTGTVRKRESGQGPAEGAGLQACVLKTDMRGDGPGSGEACRDSTEPTYDDLHASAQVTAQDNDLHPSARVSDSSPDPAGDSETLEGTNLHVCASPLNGDGAASCDGILRDAGATGFPSARDAGLHNGARPVTARELLAALDADEEAVPLPGRTCRITLWLEPEVLSMWKTRWAASRHESGGPMEAWEVLALLMYNYWKTWDNRETRRQMREHKTLERDGWRCTAPGCTSMGSGILHEHHIIYRSRGGAVADLTNTTTLCTAHHLGLLHGGFIRCYGEAPDNLTWELGIGGDQPPFLIYKGDTLVGGTGM